MPEIDLNAPILPGVENRTIVVNDNLPALRALPDACVDLIYLDPPFNSGRPYLNPIGLDEQEERGLLQDIRLPAPMERRDPQVVQERLVGFVDVFTMEPGDPNWKEEWTEEIGEVIPALPPILEGAGRAHSPSMQGYLTFMAVRLVEMQRILKPTGSVYLHCDPTASHYLKSIMDSVFGAANFRNEIVWRRTSAHSNANRCGAVHDTLLYYSKTDKRAWNAGVHQAYDSSYIEDYYRYTDEEGRRFQSGDLTVPSAAANRRFEWLGATPAKGRGWGLDLDGLEKLRAEDRIFITKNGFPRLKRYLDEAKGMALQDIWADVQAVRSWHKEATKYPTQKPLALLERIIEASSNPGDVVLDPFCGCATACVAAEHLERRWIGMDMGVEAYRQVVKRLRGTFPEMEVEGVTAGLPDGKRVHRVAELPGQTNEPIRPVSAADAAAAASRRQWTIEERRDLYGRQEGYCLGCGVRTDFRQMHVDHVIPWIKSGPDVMANAQLLCGHCNERKGVRTMPELWKMTRDKGLLVNQRQVELLYRERDAERMADEKLSKPGFRELWQLPEE